MKNQIAVMTKPAPIMPKMAKMAPVGTEVGGMTPSPGRQLGLVASFWRFWREAEADVRVVEKEGRELAERTATSLMLLPESWARSRKEEREEAATSGTGAIMVVLPKREVCGLCVECFDVLEE